MQGAPKGNQFWKLRSKHGRNRIFGTPAILWKAATEYFEWVDSHPWIKKEQLKNPIKKTDQKGNVTWEVITDVPTARPYTLSGLCIYLDVNSQYFMNFKQSLEPKEGKKQTKKQKDFSTVILRVEEIIRTQKFEGAAVGTFNSNIIAREMGMVDRKDVTTQGKPISNKLEIEIVEPNDEE